MTHQKYIADRCAADPEFAREYYSPERDWFLAGAIAQHSRTRAGISLPKLAKRCNVAASTIKDFQNGQPIAQGDLDRIRAALQQSPQAV